jgi:hypothetical protein
MQRTGTDSHTSACTPALSAGAQRSLIVLLSLAAPALAHEPRVVVSTTDDVPAGAGVPFAVDDGELVAAGGTAAPGPFFMEGHFQATCGFAPSDIDAFARLPGATSGSAGSLVFSLLSNEGGFLDGDVIGIGPGNGALLVVSEQEIANALGTPGAAIDVDALSYDDQGRLLFSLQTDLVGTVLGDVLDGDILRVDAGSAVALVMGEDEVQARFTAATGLADAILDVQALEWAQGELWAAVQSPSSHDGAVIKLSGTPQIVVDEALMGLGGAEVDALGEVRPGEEIVAFQVSLVDALPGDLMHVEVYGQPFAVLMVLMAGNTGYVDFSRWAGFGGWYLDRFDPWLSGVLAAHRVPFVTLDSNGRFATDWSLPTSMVFGPGIAGELGWSFQVFDLTNSELSAPLRVRKL